MRHEVDGVDRDELAVDVKLEPVIRVNVGSDGIRNARFYDPVWGGSAASLVLGEGRKG